MLRVCSSSDDILISDEFPCEGRVAGGRDGAWNQPVLPAYISLIWGGLGGGVVVGGGGGGGTRKRKGGVGGGITNLGAVVIGGGRSQRCFILLASVSSLLQIPSLSEDLLISPSCGRGLGGETTDLIAGGSSGGLQRCLTPLARMLASISSLIVALQLLAASFFLSSSFSFNPV